MESCANFQVYISHITQQTIQLVLFVSFIDIQYVCPLRITSNWLSIYNNPQHSSFHVEGKRLIVHLSR